MNGASKKMMEAYVKSTNYISNQTETMREEVSNKESSRAVKMFYSAVGTMCGLSAVAGMCGIASADAAGNIANGIGALFKSVFSAIITVSTVLMVTIVAICFFIRMFSHNPRSAESATEWMKRAIISWIVINALNLLVEIGRDIIQSAGGTNTDPWA